MAHSKTQQLDALINSFLSSNISSDVSADDPTVVSSHMDPSVKPVGTRPQSPESMNDGNGGDPGSKPRKGRSSLDVVTLVSSSCPALTKREHALHELLSSERAYASDLALIRDIHIPAALGTLLV